MLSLIAAMGKLREIGFENALPWHLPDDFKYFKDKTNGHAIIMGRRNFEAMGRPLPNRKNIVITRSHDYIAPGAMVVNSLDEAIKEAGDDPEIFIIGGAEIYKIALPLVDRMYLTYVDAEVPADTFFPEFSEAEWRVASSEHHPADERHAHSFTFKVLDRI